MAKRFALLMAMILPLFGCDQITKAYATEHLLGVQPMSFLSGFITLTYHENAGAFLSLGTTLSPTMRTVIFSILVLIALIAALIYLCIKTISKLHLISSALILAGGFGNVFDRITNDGSVVDFVLLQLGPLRTGVFNAADVFIMVGAFVLILLSTKRGEALAARFQ